MFTELSNLVMFIRKRKKSSRVSGKIGRIGGPGRKAFFL